MGLSYGRDIFMIWSQLRTKKKYKHVLNSSSQFKNLQLLKKKKIKIFVQKFNLKERK